MKKDELLTVFGTHDIRTLPECIMSLLFGDQEVRDDVFRELIRCHAGDLSYDWFQEVYEEELSERRKKGQDFTPREVSMLETQLTGAREGVIHEPTAGTGGLIIQYWWEMASKQLPWRFKPHTCIFTCWELSDRSIPILLLNMAIRGMMGEVFHGDVLENVAKARYVLPNGMYVRPTQGWVSGWVHSYSIKNRRYTYWLYSAFVGSRSKGEHPRRLKTSSSRHEAYMALMEYNKL